MFAIFYWCVYLFVTKKRNTKYIYNIIVSLLTPGYVSSVMYPVLWLCQSGQHEAERGVFTLYIYKYFHYFVSE